MLSALIKYVLLVLVVAWIVNTISPSKLGSARLHIDSQRMTSAEVERQSLQRDRQGLPPLSNDEIESIASQSVSRALKNQRQN